MSLHSHYSRARTRFLLAVSLLFPAMSQGQNDFIEQVESRVLTLVNDARSDYGLRPVEREARLDAAASDFADYVAASGTLDHQADGRTPAARVKQRGYDYCTISENIAFEYSSRGFSVERLARNFIDGWLQSPTHRENILDPNVTQTGVGVARNARNEYYAAQLFGRPAIAASAQPASKGKTRQKQKRAPRC